MCVWVFELFVVFSFVKKPLWDQASGLESGFCFFPLVSLYLDFCLRLLFLLPIPKLRNQLRMNVASVSVCVFECVSTFDCVFTLLNPLLEENTLRSGIRFESGFFSFNSGLGLRINLQSRSCIEINEATHAWVCAHWCLFPFASLIFIVTDLYALLWYPPIGQGHAGLVLETLNCL